MSDSMLCWRSNRSSCEVSVRVSASPSNARSIQLSSIRSICVSIPRVCDPEFVRAASALDRDSQSSCDHGASTKRDKHDSLSAVETIDGPFASRNAVRMSYPAVWRGGGDSGEHNLKRMGCRVDRRGGGECVPTVPIAEANDLATLRDGTAWDVSASINASNWRGGETVGGAGVGMLSALPRRQPAKGKALVLARCLDGLCTSSFCEGIQRAVAEVNIAHKSEAMRGELTS